MVPVLSEPAVPVVNVFVAAKVKQYKVPTLKSPLGKVTVCPDTADAVPIPTQAVEPEGMSVVATVQFDAVEFTVKPVGKVTCTSASVPVVDGSAQTNPPVVVLAVILSILKYACAKIALAFLTNTNEVTDTINTSINPKPKLCFSDTSIFIIII